MIQGQATGAGTAAYAKQHPHLQYLPLQEQGLLVSQAGFGCYRVDVSVEAHRQALRQALLSGVNLIDTSANYSDGGSEELVGRVLAEMIRAGEISREQVVVVSKVGYLQGQNYEISQLRKKEGHPFPDLVLYSQGLEHCIHPEFLADQLTRSLARLEMETLDCYLLHNPEYYLGWAQHQGLLVDEARAEYYRRIELAFRHLEREVERGRIRSYGISSNTFPVAVGDYQFTSLETVWSIAESVSPTHHFRVIQLPMNLYETGGMTERNQSTGETVIEFAKDKGLGVLINRPLNAFHKNKLIRLADVEVPPQEEIEKIPGLLRGLVQMEADLQESLLPRLELEASEREQVVDKVAAGVLLEQHWRSFSSGEHWRDVQAQFLVPTVQRGIQMLLQKQEQTEDVAAWIESYAEQVNHVMQMISLYYQAQAAQDVEAIKSRVRQVDGEWGSGQTLSQMAIRALRSTTGITTVLVGMRQESYLLDVVEELSRQVARSDHSSAWQTIRSSI